MFCLSLAMHVIILYSRLHVVYTILLCECMFYSNKPGVHVCVFTHHHAHTIIAQLCFRSCSLWQGLSFLLLFLCIGMLLYFPVGRLCLKWPTHGVSYSPNMDIPEDHMTLTASPKHNDDDKNHAYAYASACAPEKTVISYITY